MLQDYEKEYFKNRKFENKYYHMAIQWLNKLVPENCFDYGCGEGFNVHAINYLGIDCNGFDISRFATSHEYGLAKGRLSSRKVVKRKYDLVMCLDVLEHVNDIKAEEIISNIITLSGKWILLSICDTTLSKVYKDRTHINIRPRAYWEHKLEAKGLIKHEVPGNWLFNKQLYLYKVN